MRRMVSYLALFLIPFATALADDTFELWPGATYDSSIPTIESVLGSKPGERITPHGDVLRYFAALAEAAPDRVLVEPYATSWEGRELVYVAIGSAENMASLDVLRESMQSLADPRETDSQEASRLIAETPGTIWLAYSVHGNEISPTDAAMFAAYHLLASQDDPVVDKILAETVVFLNPLQNPDGRDRFVHGFEMARGLEDDASPLSAEHIEPWPSGRVNHYLFDMNRDWIALTQPETQGHVRALLEWYPLVFVDLHEMGSNSTYYFAPEAVPFNPHIVKAQRSSLEIFGRNNAHWFDRFGLDYFTREIFDAFYPGYGASWPLYYGAVAMTYEQASARGLRMRRRNGSEFPYRETVRNHFVTSISTAQAVAENRQELLQNFYDYRKSAIAAGRQEAFGAYILSGRPDPSTADKLADLLVQQGIEVGRASTSFEACGKEYEAGSYVISLAQPSNRLIHTLLDDHVAMEEDFLAEQERRRAKDQGHEIYDITSWSLPLMFNLEIDACSPKTSIQVERVKADDLPPGSISNRTAEVAYLVPWDGQAAMRLLAGALRAGLAVKTTDKAFRLGERDFPAGTLIFKVPDNSDRLPTELERLALETGAEVVGTSDSWVERGPNFGSMNVLDIPAPRIAIAWDDPTSSYSAGATRFVVERQIGYPVSAIRTASLGGGDLRHFDVLILPEQSRRYGSYQKSLGEKGAANLERWVEQGGTLIVLGNAMRFAADPKIDLLSVRREDAFTEGIERDRDEGEEENRATVEGQLLVDADDLAAAIAPEVEAPDSLPGAIVRANVDRDHWLGAGLPPTLNVMARGSDIYTPLALDQGRNVAHFAAADDLLASGYLWQENRDQMAFKPFAIVERQGLGFVIGFTQNPSFRAYMDGLNGILMNAIFRGPAHARAAR